MPNDQSSNGHTLTGDGHDPSLVELRKILVEPFREDVEDLRRRVQKVELREEEVTAADVSQVLPEAVRRRSDDTDGELSEALAPTIEKTLHLSVERDPQPIVDAIFPVIGPAIRKAVSEALSSLMANVNRTLEHGFSLKGLRWRWEAWRTGRSFAEVVLRHTLLYRVEQMFLIDRETGLPLQRVAADKIDQQAEDSALVSGMLTAIQDFVHDSFDLDDEETLQDFTVGNLSVWIDHGPHAALAAVIRGNPDPRLREVMHQITERIHRQFRRELAEFDGDAAAFDDTRPILERGLLAQYEEPSSTPTPMLWVLIVLVVGLLGWWGYETWQAHQRWQSYVTQLEEEPGLVINRTSTESGQWVVRGLRDPIATHPDSLLAASPVPPEDVRGVWDTYQSLDPAMVARRGQARIERETVLFERLLQLNNGQMVVIDRVADHIMELHGAARDIGRTLLVEVQGYHSIEGGDGINRYLSHERATIVRNRLVERGVPAQILQAIPVLRPFRPDIAGTEQGRRYNRTVAFKVLLQE